jgi:hypothetical protein
MARDTEEHSHPLLRDFKVNVLLCTRDERHYDRIAGRTDNDTTRAKFFLNDRYANTRRGLGNRLYRDQSTLFSGCRHNQRVFLKIYLWKWQSPYLRDVPRLGSSMLTVSIPQVASVCFMAAIFIS